MEYYDPPVTQKFVEPDDELLFIFGNVASLNTRPQII